MSNTCAAGLTLAHSFDKSKLHKVTFPCWLPPKLNGIRATYRDGNFYSRDNKKWNFKVLEHLLRPLRKALGKTFQLDGELYKHGWPLQRINSAIAVKRILPTEESPLIEYHVFDCVAKKLTFAERRKIARALVQELDHPSIIWVKHPMMESFEQAERLYKLYVRRKYEGAMFRLEDDGYKPCRSHFLLKWKDFKDDEFEIFDVLEGKVTAIGGKHVGRMGALVCLTKSGKKFNVGTGYDDAERDRMWKKRPVGKMLTVRYLDLSNEGIPLNPSALGIRNYE